MADSEVVKDEHVETKDEHNENKKSEHIEQVHSANAWEKADLGDEERKNKFLRLMGAGKKEHHGKIVIGDHNPEHARKKDETQKLEHQLEDQYTQSLQHRLAGGRRGHIGLGFHDDDDDNNKETEPQETAEKGEDDKGDSCKGDKDTKEEEKEDSEGQEIDKTDKKRESTGDEADEDAPVEKKMKFVKSSS